MPHAALHTGPTSGLGCLGRLQGLGVGMVDMVDVVDSKVGKKAMMQRRIGRASRRPACRRGGRLVVGSWLRKSKQAFNQPRGARTDVVDGDGGLGVLCEDGVQDLQLVGLANLLRLGKRASK